MTILINDMGDTVIGSFKRGTFTLADWTVLPKAGVWRAFCEAHPVLLRSTRKRQKQQGEKRTDKRVADGLHAGSEDEDPNPPAVTLEDVALLDQLEDSELACKLSLAIRKTANDLNASPPKRYSYEEWAEFTRLIRFSSVNREQLTEEEDEVGLIEWDWIGEDSPMLAKKTESEWILDRLCESLNRYLRRADVGEGEGGKNLG